MGPFKFKLRTLASNFVNLFQKGEDKNKPVERVFPEKEPEELEAEGLRKKKPIFDTFDTSYDFLKLLEQTVEPIVHVVFEDEPSTSYHLPRLVLQCRLKGEWYVFSRGRIAFEGSHSGWNSSVDFFHKIKEDKIPVSLWILDAEKVALLEGYSTWPEIRNHVVPLLAAPKFDHKWSTIQRNVERLLSEEISR